MSASRARCFRAATISRRRVSRLTRPGSKVSSVRGSMRRSSSPWTVCATKPAARLTHPRRVHEGGAPLEEDILCTLRLCFPFEEIDNQVAPRDHCANLGTCQQSPHRGRHLGGGQGL